MALPTVGQSLLIANELDILVRIRSPDSVAIIGCAGGNGFDRVARSNQSIAAEVLREPRK